LSLSLSKKIIIIIIIIIILTIRNYKKLNKKVLKWLKIKTKKIAQNFPNLRKNQKNCPI
jgi:hypothetical protein